MTSHFDNLGSLHYLSMKDKATYDKVRPLLDWLTSECITQADSKEPDRWTYAIWIAFHNSRRKNANETVEARKNDPLIMVDPNNLENRFEFLNDCHDRLDHGKWHLKVFDADLAMLISHLQGMLCEGREAFGWQRDWKYVRKAYPQIEDLMAKCGFIKEVEGKGKFDYRLTFPRSAPKV